MSFGAPLEEVWGQDLETHPRRGAAKRDKPRPQKENNSDALCDLALATKKLDDIMNYFEKTPEPFDKTPTSRTQKPLPETDAEPRGEEVVYATKENVFPMPKDRKVFVEGFDSQRSREKQYLDFALYVFSGIVLIFVMEQFVNIGIHLQKRLS